MFLAGRKELGEETGIGWLDAERSKTEFWANLLSYYGLWNSFTYQKPTVNPLPDDPAQGTGLMLPDSSGGAMIPAPDTPPVLGQAGEDTKLIPPQVGGEGGTSTLDDWVNRIPELEKQAPIEIPSNATVKVQAKNGYDQISFKWTENGQNYEVRWHTKTPGAPEGQGNTWVVSRVTPGTPTGQVRTEHILVGDTWIPRYQWQDAINAYRNGTATQEQLQLLKDGHWQAP